jgi:ribonuclease VapC
VIVDASAAIALAFGEPHAAWLQSVMGRHATEPWGIAWTNIAEVEIQYAKRRTRSSVQELLARLRIEPLADTFAISRLVGDARIRFPINLGDCFAYAHAKVRNEPLLTLDKDFLKTDLTRVLHPDAV